MDLKDYRRAIEDYNKIFQLSPKLPDELIAMVYYCRGICYRELGETAKARADFDKAEKFEKQQ